MKAIKIAYNRRNGTFSIQSYNPSHKSWEKRPVGFKTIGIIPYCIVDHALDNLSKFIEEETGTDDRVLAKMRGQIMVFLADYIEALN